MCSNLYKSTLIDFVKTKTKNNKNKTNNTTTKTKHVETKTKHKNNSRRKGSTPEVTIRSLTRTL
jgi:uncharacterized membrane protein